jgi:hypothetical protein
MPALFKSQLLADLLRIHELLAFLCVPQSVPRSLRSISSQVAGSFTVACFPTAL